MRLEENYLFLIWEFWWLVWWIRHVNNFHLQWEKSSVGTQNTETHWNKVDWKHSDNCNSYGISQNWPRDTNKMEKLTQTGKSHIDYICWEQKIGLKQESKRRLRVSNNTTQLINKLQLAQTSSLFCSFGKTNRGAAANFQILCVQLAQLKVNQFWSLQRIWVSTSKLKLFWAHQIYTLSLQIKIC